METTFRPSLTLVPSLANCSLSLCTLSLTESPPSHTQTCHSSFWRHSVKFYSPDRVSRLRSTSTELLRSAAPPASLWQSLLGMLSSLSHLVSGGRLRMRSLQICLHRSWDRLVPSAPVALSPGPKVVASQGSPISRGFSPSGVPRSGLLVRRFRRRLGSSGGFRPLGPVGDSSPGQCQGVAGGAAGSPPLPVLSVRGHGGCVLRQRHRSRISAQGGGHAVSCSQHHRAGDPLLGGIPSDSVGSAVHSGDPQCSRGLSLPSSSTPQLQVVSQHGGVSIFGASVAGDDRPICHLRQSPLLHIFLALLRPSYAFPPWSILPQVLAKLQVSNRTLLTLVAPYWPPQPWFVDLLQLSVAPPVVHPARRDLLFQPRSHQRYPGLHRLALHAWRLSSDSPERLVSPQW